LVKKRFLVEPSVAENKKKSPKRSEKERTRIAAKKPVDV